LGTLGVVIAVRNEEERIGQTLRALDAQTLRPGHVAVVDDGSTDNTPEVLRKMSGAVGFVLHVITLPFHRDSKVGRPELAAVFNAGLAWLRGLEPRPEFVMILGADHRLPGDYIEKILERLERNPRLAAASGWIADEPYWEHAPRGSSMIVRSDFWEDAGKMQFPQAYGWESWLYLKASEQGYETRSFKEIPTRITRRTSMKKGIPYGRAMYALGYYWPYAVGRCILAFPRSPRGAVQMLAGYLDHGGVQRLDVSGWVGETQKRVFLRRAGRILARFGRR
jgi:poly-beta-1,6-N-acetyl-D-glucosamine synthase